MRRRAWYRHIFAKKHRKKTTRYALFVANILVLFGVLFFVAYVPGSTQTSPSNSISKITSEDIASNPLDQLSSADIAVHIAQAAHLSETTSVVNNADTVNAELAVSPAGDIVAAKPQIIATGLKSRKGIKNYTVKANDTIESIANQFGITSDTIRWSNGITGDTVAVGTTLVISPINGIVYKVQAGDTLASIASKYQANKDLLAVFNDVETGKLPVGQYIVIPDGVPPTQVGVAPTLASINSSAGFAWGGYSPIYGSNGYEFGNCTWWAAFRRSQIGHPIPSNLGNASTWKTLAQRSGLGVGSTPQKGAIIWTPPRDYYGHVGFVESVNPDGSVNISEMNVAGWNVVNKRTLSKSEAAAYSYIY